jgi:ArsR family transcriptional regulator, lead/cadmium/zinc/bismuth-responsive transcriptional repressor
MSRKTSTVVNTSCALGDRPLISDRIALDLQGLFKVLANDGRLKLIHALERAGEMTVTELAETVSMSTQACSNQLQRLVDQGILASKRDGNHMHYRIVDRTDNSQAIIAQPSVLVSIPINSLISTWGSVHE